MNSIRQKHTNAQYGGRGKICLYATLLVSLVFYFQWRWFQPGPSVSSQAELQQSLAQQDHEEPAEDSAAETLSSLESETVAYPVVTTPEFVFGGTWGATKREAHLTEAPTPGCHATTLLHLEDGRVMMAWFGGSFEGAEDVGIWVSVRSPETGWSTPHQLPKVKRGKPYGGRGTKYGGPYKVAEPKRQGGEPHWNPVLWCGDSKNDPTAGDGAAAGPCKGEIILYFKVGWKIPTWVTYETRSKDQGLTWSPARILVPGDKRGGRGPVKNKPILLSNGKWAAPASLESAPTRQNRKRVWQAFVDTSSDGGTTWEMGPVLSVPEGYGVIQPSLWESAPGHIHMLLRGRDWTEKDKSNRVWRSDSHNGGKTWSKVYKTKLRGNNSGLDVARMPLSGTLVLALNPTSNGGQRWPLQLAISDNNGETWQVGLEIEVEHGNLLQGHEYSYPACVPWPLPSGSTDPSDEGFSLSYTWHRQRVVYLSMSLRELRERAKPNAHVVDTH